MRAWPTEALFSVLLLRWCTADIYRNEIELFPFEALEYIALTVASELSWELHLPRAWFGSNIEKDEWTDHHPQPFKRFKEI